MVEGHRGERKMLLQSCMRSASTSLSTFLIKASETKRHEHRQHILPRVTGFEEFPSSTAGIVSEDVLTDWVCNKSYFIQEHILPIKEHREILLSIPRERRKVVVLKRPGIDSWKSHCSRQSIKKSETFRTQSCKNSFVKFRNDLDIYFPESDGYLHVEMGEIINYETQERTLRKILDYYGIECESIPTFPWDRKGK